MSIPKVIHYCWFGGKPKPKSVCCCIKSWRKYCPDYEIIEWNESNFDYTANRYAREAYEQKNWAFVSDYARLQIIWERGGIYLDTDVELIRSLDGLLTGEGFFGFESEKEVATGLGFGAVAGHPVVAALLADYKDIPFVREDGTLDTLSCPARNTATLCALGLRADNTMQTIQGISFLPTDYLCPMDYRTGKKRFTDHTYSIHHYDASWRSRAGRRSMALQRVVGVRVYAILYTRILSKLGGWEWP